MEVPSSSIMLEKRQASSFIFFHHIIFETSYARLNMVTERSMCTCVEDYLFVV